MAIKSYNQNGETWFQVYVNVRSKNSQSLRTQRRVSGVKTEREAEREEIKLIRECERELAEKEHQGATWEAVVEAWEKFIADTHRTNEITRSDYIGAIDKHTFSWKRRLAAEITPSDVREVLTQMKAQGRSLSYRNKIKVVLNRVFTFGIENGLIRGTDRSPTYGIQLGRIEEKKPEILSLSEIRTLLEEARRLEHRWYPVWAMALLTGMRNGELYALQWADVDWENDVISVNKSYNCRARSVKCTKSGHWRSVPISSELRVLLQELRATAGDREHVLPRLPSWKEGEQAEILRQFCEGIGLPSVKFHTLRACFATQLIRNGVPPIQIQKICGWKDLKTMQRYVRLAAIETKGATEGLKVLPAQEVAAKVVHLFGRNVQTEAKA